MPSEILGCPCPCLIHPAIQQRPAAVASPSRLPSPSAQICSTTLPIALLALPIASLALTITVLALAIVPLQIALSEHEVVQLDSIH